MSIRAHSLWPEIRREVKVELYAPDGGHKNPRFRLEFNKGIPWATKRRWMAITVACIECGREIHPVRARRNCGEVERTGCLYIAAACPLDVRLGCSRGSAVHEEYLAIRRDCEREGK